MAAGCANLEKDLLAGCSCHTRRALSSAPGCAALAQGVVHRDLKPENILLSDESLRPTLKVTGLAMYLKREHTRNAAQPSKCRWRRGVSWV